MMKKGILFGLTLLFLLSFVVAGESYRVDFSELRTQSVYFYEGDEVRFNLLGGEHVIIIEDVGTSSIKIDYGFYLNENTELNPGLVGLDYLMRADVDKDGTVDLNVALYSIAENGEVQLVLQDVTRTDSSEVTGQVGKIDEVVSGFNYKTVILVVVGVLVLGLVGYLIFRGSGKKETSEEITEPVERKSNTFESGEGL